jgi:hypothetical protein
MKRKVEEVDDLEDDGNAVVDVSPAKPCASQARVATGPQEQDDEARRHQGPLLYDSASLLILLSNPFSPVQIGCLENQISCIDSDVDVDDPGNVVSMADICPRRRCPAAAAAAAAGASSSSRRGASSDGAAGRRWRPRGRPRRSHSEARSCPPRP